MMDLLTPDQLADELGVATKTLANWRHRGGGPAFVKVGTHPRYRRIDVERWLDARHHHRSHERAVS